MATSAAESNVLFGLLALQNSLIDQNQLVAAFRAWTRDCSHPVADYFAARGDLDPDQRAGVEAMVGLHLKKHGGDAARSIAALHASASTLESLAAIGDPAIEQTLTQLSSSFDGHTGTTASDTVGTTTTNGQRFRVLRPHARGGLGEVFVALDTELNREVALKQILDRHADDPTSRARFVMEAEITGGLEHPGIVPIYGLGTYAEGRPYYAMRFINGVSLRVAVDRFHADAALKDDPARRALELRKLLRRFTDVCDAIGYAHSRGVLHRDIKPGNVIIGRYGETFVVDWGLAKATGRADPGAGPGEQTLIPSSASGSAETLPGSALGTPAYMSPEQAEADIEKLGSRSDVYSLGATLYYLLTGRPPFNGEIEAVLGALCRGDFPRPRQHDSKIDRGLEAICLKAMALHPEDRYASARAVAEDVERWMAGESVSAWREPIAQRARRWARRHRTAVTAAGVALIAGVIGLSSVLAVQARANSVLASANSELSRSKQAVQARYQLAIQAIRTFHTGVSQDFLLSQPQFKDLRGRLLRSASDFYERLNTLLASEKDIDSRRALTGSQFELALLTGQVGRNEEALAVHQAVLAEREALAAEAGADPEATVDVAESQTEVAKGLDAAGKKADAMAALRRSESLLERLVPEYRSARGALAECRFQLGGMLAAFGRTGEALVAYRRALADREVLARAPDGGTGIRIALAVTVDRIGALLSSIGRPADAEVEYRKAQELYRELAGDRSTEPLLSSRRASNYHRLGILFMETGRSKEAEAEFRQVITIGERLTHDYPAVRIFWAQLALAHNLLAVVLTATDRRPEAEAEFRRAIAVHHKLAEDNPGVASLQADLAGGHLNLGNTLRATGQPAVAETEFRAATAILRQLVNEHPSIPSYRDNLAGSRCNLGSLLAATGRLAQAEAELREAVAIHQGLAVGHPTVVGYRASAAGSHLELGLLLSSAGLPDQAESELRSAAAILERLVAENPTVSGFRSDLGESQLGLGEVLRLVGRARDAEEAYLRALALYEVLADANRADPGFRARVAHCRIRLGNLLTEAGRRSGAERELRAGLTISLDLAERHANMPGFRNDAAGAYTHLADLLRSRGRLEEARVSYDRAIALRAGLLKSSEDTPRYRADQASSLRRAGLARAELGDLTGATADTHRALEIFDSLASRSAEQWFETACCHAALGVHAGSGETERERAIDLLRRAIVMGYRNRDALSSEPALYALRDRDDFKLLMMDLAMPASPFARGR